MKFKDLRSGSIDLLILEIESYLQKNLLFDFQINEFKNIFYFKIKGEVLY